MAADGDDETVRFRYPVIRINLSELPFGYARDHDMTLSVPIRLEIRSKAQAPPTSQPQSLRRHRDAELPEHGGGRGEEPDQPASNRQAASLDNNDVGMAAAAEEVVSSQEQPDFQPHEQQSQTPLLDSLVTPPCRPGPPPRDTQPHEPRSVPVLRRLTQFEYTSYSRAGDIGPARGDVQGSGAASASSDHHGGSPHAEAAGSSGLNDGAANAPSGAAGVSAMTVPKAATPMRRVSDALRSLERVVD